MTSPSRTLVVMRHAAAESSGPSDAERALTAHGRTVAVDVGRWLAEHDVTPTTALVSSALRTRETWAGLREGAGWSLEADLEDGLYAADPDAALDLVRGVAAEAACVLVLGHNPTMGFLAQLLDDGDGSAQDVTAMARGFPTAAAAVLTYDGAWADLETGSARLRAFHAPRG